MKHRIGWIALLFISVIVNIYTTNIHQQKIVEQENEIEGWKTMTKNRRYSENVDKLQDYIKNTNWRVK